MINWKYFDESFIKNSDIKLELLDLIVLILVVDWNWVETDVIWVQKVFLRVFKMWILFQKINIFQEKDKHKFQDFHPFVSNFSKEIQKLSWKLKW